MLPSSARKRWNLHDGPRGSLRRLRNQLAEDGCTESQVILAKSLLEEECELEADKISNFKQAVEWLICATEKGHHEARMLLKGCQKCIHSGVVGENSSAIVRAKSCLAANRQEKVARKAARDLFASLSNGEEYITTAQLERRIREICSTTLHERSGEEDEDEAGQGGQFIEDGGSNAAALQPSDDRGDRREQRNGTVGMSGVIGDDHDEISCEDSNIQNLTVDNLVSAAVRYCQGELPLISRDLTLTDPSIKALDHIPLMQQAFLHPLIFIQILYLKLLYYFGTFSFRLSNVQLTFFLLAYMILGAENITLFFPLVMYYISFVAMVIYTFKMLHAKRQFVDFRKWSGLFLRYSDGNLQPDESEDQYVRNNFSPFVKFFLSLILNLFLYPFVATQWIPFSEFSVLSLFLMFTTLLSFGGDDNSYPNVLGFISFSINVLAKYPYEKDTVVHQGWRFLDLHIQNYPSYIVGNSIEFCLNARVFFSLLIPVILLLMSKRSKWRGIYMYAIPHCVTLSWLQLFIVCSQGSTTYGLIRGTLALVCLLFFLPLMGIATLFLPLFAFLQGVTLSNVLYSAAIVGGVATCLAVTCVMARLEATKKYITTFQLTIGLVALLYLSSPFIHNLQDSLPQDSLSNLHWEKKTERSYYSPPSHYSDEGSYGYVGWSEYYGSCHQPAWSEANVAATQIKCSVLNGASVSWQGYVTDVSVVSLDNRWSSFAALLPTFIQEFFSCRYGEDLLAVCEAEGGHECVFLRNVAKVTGRRCFLNNFDRYTYEIKTNLDTGGLLTKSVEVTLVTDHYFSNFTRLLKSQDKIRFKGTLLSNYDKRFSIGSREPAVQLYEITCTECANQEVQGITVNSKITSGNLKFTNWCKTMVNDITVSAKYILNFLLNPIVVFK